MTAHDRRVLTNLRQELLDNAEALRNTLAFMRPRSEGLLSVGWRHLQKYLDRAAAINAMIILADRSRSGPGPADRKG